MSHVPFIAIHCGAGYHHPSKERFYLTCLENACREGYSALQQSSNGSETLAVKAVLEAVKCMELDPLTNAGLGSNLTMDGRVECDAAIMCGQSMSFGSVCGVSDALSPIDRALSVMQLDRQRIGPCGLIQPISKSHLNIGTPLQDLITASQQKQHARYQELLQQDTVGAIAVDKDGNVAAAVSSGGLWLKSSGRIGSAAHYGSGIHVEQSSQGRMACCTSGTGEQIMKCLFSSTVCRKLRKEEKDGVQILSKMLDRKTHGRLMDGYPDFCVGALAFRCDCVYGEFSGSCRSELWVGHSSHSMGIAWMSDKDTQPITMISRKSSGHEYMVSGIRIN